MIDERSREILALDHLLHTIERQNILQMADDERLEGGDIMPVGEYLFVGYAKPEDFAKYKVARTNESGLEFLKKNFPKRTVKGFELNKSDTIAKENALHLDCCFQPLGLGHAIVFPGGFKNAEDVDFIKNYFGSENIIEISADEMYEMNSNVFSIDKDVVISEKGFTRVNAIMRELGYTVEEVSYSEVSKMEAF